MSKLSLYIDTREHHKGIQDYIVDDRKNVGSVIAITPGQGADVDNIIKDYIEGYPRKYIQAKYLISNGQLSSHLQARGVPLRYPSRRKTSMERRIKHLTEEDRQEIIRDYLNGVSGEAIYKKYSIHKNGLYTLLDIHNIKRKKGD